MIKSIVSIIGLITMVQAATAQAGRMEPAEMAQLSRGMPPTASTISLERLGFRYVGFRDDFGFALGYWSKGCQTTVYMCPYDYATRSYKTCRPAYMRWMQAYCQKF